MSRVFFVEKEKRLPGASTTTSLSSSECDIRFVFQTLSSVLLDENDVFCMDNILLTLFLSNSFSYQEFFFFVSIKINFRAKKCLNFLFFFNLKISLKISTQIHLYQIDVASIYIKYISVLYRHCFPFVNLHFFVHLLCLLRGKKRNDSYRNLDQTKKKNDCVLFISPTNTSNKKKHILSIHLEFLLIIIDKQIFPID